MLTWVPSIASTTCGKSTLSFIIHVCFVLGNGKFNKLPLPAVGGSAKLVAHLYSWGFSNTKGYGSSAKSISCTQSP